jgi:hypothetical protein
MFCDWLVDTVLALWAGDLGNPIALVVGPKAAGNPIALVVGPKAAREIGALLATHTHQIPLCGRSARVCAGRWFRVFVLHFFLPPPGELCDRGWSQLGGGHSGDAFWRDLGGKRPRLWPLVRCALNRA